jgi:uncharacterized glyoxalase superfamily protein PhnB
MPLSPYISFAGNCAEASAFYQHAVGAELFIKSPSAKCQKAITVQKAVPLACSSRIPLSLTPMSASLAAIS